VDRDSVLLAELVRPWGVRGEALATLHADDPARLDEVAAVELVPRRGAPRRARLEGWKVAGGRVVLKLEGVDSVEAARALAGAEVRIPGAEARRRAPEGRVFAYQLEGMKVVAADGRPLGEVVRVLRPAGQSLLEVRGGRGLFLVPLVAAICKEIDVAGGRIVVDPPEGLIELNAV
jgi:16S rRNA processing protein RimM